MNSHDKNEPRLTPSDTHRVDDHVSGSSLAESIETAAYLDHAAFYLDQFLPHNRMYYASSHEQHEGQEKEMTLVNQVAEYNANTIPLHKHDQVSSVANYLTALTDSSQLNPASSNPHQGIWSGINNFLANVTPSNIFRPTLAIPNIATRFSEYLANYPVSLWNATESTSAEESEKEGHVQPHLQDLEYVPSLQQIYPNDETMNIRVLGVPQTGAKSRVETQIKLCLQLVTPGGGKATGWTHLKLPEKTVTKDKSSKKLKQVNVSGNCVPSRSECTGNEKMLFLRAWVTCASDVFKQVTTCHGCIQRERKRLQRRKDARYTGMDEDDPSAIALDEQRILLFSCSDIVEFDSGATILPTRITCYCRHHNERVGFCIHFEMLDYKGNMVAKGMSPPIMITDDHKSKVKSSHKRHRSPEYEDNLSNENNYAKKVKPELPEDQPSHQDAKDYEPYIHRVIPDKVPIRSATEVTVLGSGFCPGLTCLFGGVEALSTQYWSPNTLICRLPPTPQACVAQVALKNYAEQQNTVSLTFYSDHERSLMELALQVVGMKMTGKVEDPKEIAHQIISSGD